jgi:putative glycosyltransferase (TIGR04372 family)
MRHRLARLGGRRWLATAPDTHSLGNAVLNLAWSFLMARKVRATLCLEPLEPHRYPELWRLRCRGVDVVPMGSAAARRALETAARLAPILGWTGAVDSAVSGDAVPDGVRDPWRFRTGFGLDFRRLLAEARLEVALGPGDRARVEADAAALGLDGDRPLVTLHVREATSKADVDRDKDVVRNASVAAYVPAIDWLVSEGYQVVRIGDPSMTPVRREGVVDLAHAPARSLGLDVFCVRRSAFFVATDSGPYNLALLCDTPCLGTNMTHLIGAYPLRERDRYIVRRVDDVAADRPLTLEGMLTPEHLKFRWDPQRYRFLDNAPSEILAGVQEMVAVTRGETAPTAEQREFRGAVEAFLESDYGRRKSKQPEGTPYFVGNGWATKDSAHTALAPGVRPHSAAG